MLPNLKLFVRNEQHSIVSDGIQPSSTTISNWPTSALLALIWNLIVESISFSFFFLVEFDKYY